MFENMAFESWVRKSLVITDASGINPLLTALLPGARVMKDQNKRQNRFVNSMSHIFSMEGIRNHEASTNEKKKTVSFLVPGKIRIWGFEEQEDFLESHPRGVCPHEVPPEVVFFLKSLLAAMRLISETCLRGEGCKDLWVRLGHSRLGSKISGASRLCSFSSRFCHVGIILLLWDLQRGGTSFRPLTFHGVAWRPVGTKIALSMLLLAGVCSLFVGEGQIWAWFLFLEWLFAWFLPHLETIGNGRTGRLGFLPDDWRTGRFQMVEAIFLWKFRKLLK